jgi:hypothetical protein
MERTRPACLLNLPSHLSLTAGGSGGGGDGNKALGLLSNLMAWVVVYGLLAGIAYVGG